MISLFYAFNTNHCCLWFSSIEITDRGYALGGLFEIPCIFDFSISLMNGGSFFWASDMTWTVTCLDSILNFYSAAGLTSFPPFIVLGCPSSSWEVFYFLAYLFLNLSYHPLEKLNATSFWGNIYFIIFFEWEMTYLLFILGFSRTNSINCSSISGKAGFLRHSLFSIVMVRYHRCKFFGWIPSLLEFILTTLFRLSPV